jgi:hypothetical protein
MNKLSNALQLNRLGIVYIMVLCEIDIKILFLTILRFGVEVKDESELAKVTILFCI